MDVFDSMHWRTTKKLLSAIGLWPFQPVIQRIVVGAFVYFIIQSIFICVFLKLVVAWGNLAETLYSVPILVYFSMIQVKITNCHLNLHKAKYLLLRVKKDWESKLEDSEFEILRNDGRIHKIIMDVYFSGLICVATVYIVLPLMSPLLDIIIPLNETRERILPYPAEYFIDIQKNFFMLYPHGAIVTPIALTVLVGFDSLYAGFVQHACSMFTIIGRRLENLTVDRNNIDEEKNSLNEHRGLQSFITCVKMHKDILQFVKLVEKYYSNYFFVLLGVIVVGLSATGFQFVVLLSGIGEKVRCLWYAMGQVTHLFFLSYVGQKLIDHSQVINESLSAAKWYDYPQKMKPIIILMLMRGKRVSTVSAGKIYVMSIENFSSVIKASMSYFAVLTSMES
ncbi:uncharacterized protein LOC103572807 [Microplitis demolitor]|uniref:uncharacterized protein LOC103572807 n=1 Tax=Microplitis demolitor TaxID=69319 RepID=UPI0006D4E7F5|nr:uncharacterized protein LOC103572807 [Microplitis demolitor]